MKIRTISAFAALATTLGFAPVLAGAQAVPTSGPASTVVYVGGNDLVLKASDGKLLNFIIPPGYQFAAGGKQVPLAELKPGTKLTQPVTPGSSPRIVSSITVVKGKVALVAPPDAVTLALSDGAKELTVPAGTTFVVGGKPLAVADLKPDMTVQATIVTIADPASPEAAAAAPPAPPAMAGVLLLAKAENEGDLPAAGSSLPLIGTIGLVFLIAGLALLFGRRASGLSPAGSLSRR